jgi:hypothetical protein
MTDREGENTSPGLSGRIEARIKEWLQGPDGLHLAPAVRTSGALPIYSDMGATFFIRPDGEILVRAHDSRDDPVVEREPRWRLAALVVGAEKYPELKELLPSRPAETADCTSCGGTGRLKVENIERTFVCGTCHGMGWLAEAV